MTNLNRLSMRSWATFAGGMLIINATTANSGAGNSVALQRALALPECAR